MQTKLAGGCGSRREGVGSSSTEGGGVLVALKVGSWVVTKELEVTVKHLEGEAG